MEDYLIEAKAALHKITVGRQAVEVTKADGSKVKFYTTNTQQLRSYIKELETAIEGNVKSRRAIGVRF